MGFNIDNVNKPIVCIAYVDNSFIRKPYITNIRPVMVRYQVIFSCVERIIPFLNLTIALPYKGITALRHSGEQLRYSRTVERGQGKRQ